MSSNPVAVWLRAGVAILAVLYVLVGAVALRELLQAGEALDLGCRLSANATVLPLPSHVHDCPLRAYERVDAVEVAGREHRIRTRRDLFASVEPGASAVRVAVTRGPQRAWLEIPVVRTSVAQRVEWLTVSIVTSSLGLSFALYLLWRSRSEAASAAAATATTLCGLFVPLLCGVDSLWLDLQWSVSIAFLPAVVLHFALLFPRRRKLVANSRALLGAVYVAAAIAAIFGVQATVQRSTAWSLVDQLTLGMAGFAWGVLILSAAAERISPATPLHRVRANSLLLGALSVVAIPAALTWSWPGLPGGALGATTLALMLLPGPLAYAATKNAFHGPKSLTQTAAMHVAYALLLGTTIVGATMVAGTFADFQPPFGSMVTWWLVLSVGLLVTAPFVRRLFSDTSSPSAHDLEPGSESQRFELTVLQEEGRAAQRLLAGICELLRPRRLSLYLETRAGAVVEAGHPGVPEFGAPELVRLAEEVVSSSQTSGRVAYLWSDRLLERPSAKALRARGAALAVELAWNESHLGVVLVGEPDRQRVPSQAEIARLAELCAHASAAIHNARLVEVIEEEVAHSGQRQTAAQVAHDLKSPLVSIQRISGKGLEVSTLDEARVILHTISNTASDAHQVLSNFVERARDDGDGVAMEHAIALATAPFASFYGDRLNLWVGEGLPRIKGAQALRRILHNLLNNAFEASDADGVVEVQVWRRDALTEIRVTDEGCGMNEAQLRLAFEQYYTTKKDGDGLGLPSCAALAAQLGGSIELESQPNRQTRAILRIPHDSPSILHD